MPAIYSPRPEHQELKEPLSWEDRYDVLGAQIEDWHLIVAERIMNGWKDEDGKQCINCQTDYFVGEHVTHHIPHAGFAALQVVLFYFEFIAFYKSGAKYHKWRIRNNTGVLRRGSTWCYFRDGVSDVFREYIDVTPSPHEALYYVFRNGLYHIGINEPFSINGEIEGVFQYHGKANYDVWTINPHKLIPKLREHFSQYIADLKNPDRKFDQLRNNFQIAFLTKYMAKNKTRIPDCKS